MRAFRASLATVAAAALVMSLGVATPALAGSGEQGGGGRGTGATYYEDPGGNYKCRNGYLVDERGQTASFGPWPGCSGDVFNDVTTSKIIQCSAGYLVFRFFGNVKDPASAVTVQRVNLPIDEFGCSVPTESKKKFKFERSRKSNFLMTPSSPSDAGVTAPKFLRDWAKLRARDTRSLEDSYAEIDFFFGAGTLPTTQKARDIMSEVWRVPSPVVKSKSGNDIGLPTSGLPVFTTRESCKDFSSPAVHQVTEGEDAFLADRLYGSLIPNLADGTARVSYETRPGQPATYFEKLNEWMRTYTTGFADDQVTNPDYQARLLGLSDGNTVLSAETLPSAEYVECGTTLNYQLQIGEEYVLESDEDGNPTKIRIPEDSKVNVNAVGYMPIFMTANGMYESYGSPGSGMSVSGVREWAERFSQAMNPAQVDYSDWCNRELARENRVKYNRKCGSQTLTQLKGPNANKAVDYKIRRYLQKWYESNIGKYYVPSSVTYRDILEFATEPGTNLKGYNTVDDNRSAMWGVARDGKSITPVQYKPKYLADNTALFIMDSSYSLKASLLPEEVPDPEPTPEPTPEPIVPDTAEPAAPVPAPPTPITPDERGFVWQLKADTKPYLEVRADNASSNTFPFVAELVSSWKSADAMERYIDDIGQRRMDAAFDAAKREWQNNYASRVTSSGPGGLAAARQTGERRANFGAARDWDPYISYRGLAMSTFLPQCNTGQEVGCPPQGTPWNAAPRVNADCDTPGCFSAAQVRNNFLTRGIGIGPSASGLALTPAYRAGSQVGLGAWSYDFFAATAKDKSVTLARTDRTPADVNMEFRANNGTRASWFVAGEYKTWDPVYKTIQVEVPATIWVPYSPPAFNDQGQELTRPVDGTRLEPRQVIDRYVPSGWKSFGRSGSYTRYQVPDNLSAVRADANGRVIEGPTGAAGCDDPNGAWNYCSPVLSGKVS